MIVPVSQGGLMFFLLYWRNLRAAQRKGYGIRAFSIAAMLTRNRDILILPAEGYGSTSPFSTEVENGGMPLKLEEMW